MIRRLAIAVAFAVAFMSGIGAAPPPPPAITPAPAPSHSVDLGNSLGVLELQGDLLPFREGAKADSTSWYTFTAVNNSKQPTTRVLRAGQPPGASLAIFPRGMRPMVMQVESAAPGVGIERSNAYGRH
ncbi:MAG: hypothetical protein KJS68_09140, partial [Alphaproteobacteria bacterium]|nr:hypothetical protein [Alphaproteobacteria bacterium]